MDINFKSGVRTIERERRRQILDCSKHPSEDLRKRNLLLTFIIQRADEARTMTNNRGQIISQPLHDVDHKQVIQLIAEIGALSAAILDTYHLEDELFSEVDESVDRLRTANYVLDDKEKNNG